MKITKTVLKEVEEIIEYCCDICGNPITRNEDVDWAKTTVTYSQPCGGHWERDIIITQHVCSIKCLQESLKGAYFGANVFLSDDLVQKIRQLNI